MNEKIERLIDFNRAKSIISTLNSNIIKEITLIFNHPKKLILFETPSIKYTVNFIKESPLLPITEEQFAKYKQELINNSAKNILFKIIDIFEENKNEKK